MVSAVGGGAANASLLPLPTLSSIVVSPSPATLYQGQSQQFTVMGLLSDGSLQALTSGLGWSASSPSVGSISSSGLLNTLSAGTESITATAPAGLLGLLSPLTGTATLTVLPILDSIAVSPAVASIGQGQTQQFTATGLFSNGATQNITNALNWSSASGTLASITSTGLATGLLPGSDTITALAPAGLTTGPLGGLLAPLTSLAALNVLSPSSPQFPSLALTPASGKKRTVVQASGANISPGSSVVVTYLSGLRSQKRATTMLCTALVGANGSFTCTGLVPAGIRSGKIGKHTVNVAVSSGQSESTTFTLLRGVVRHR